MSTDMSCPESVPTPRLRMTPITAERYVSADYFHREWKQMWMRTWQIGGIAYQAPEPGDYLVCDLGPESILIVRQDDGGFKAFYNVCPHRGGPLGEGTLDGNVVTCPWHGWRFDVCTGQNPMIPTAKVEKFECVVEGNDVKVRIDGA